ncbi:MAG: hypothetical protein ACK5NT_06775 [Pyrinomonadaceae bacterium]
MHEIEFIKNFVIKTKRDRFLSFVMNEKGRKKFLMELEHPGFFIDNPNVRTINPYQTAIEFENRLIQLSGVNSCYVISSNPTIDGKELSISEALLKVVEGNFGTILSIVPGKIAFFEDEDGERSIFFRK